ncbi:IclR family transcriptional regulator [Saccharomonospora sp. NPDC046836]|uniref:IclR family transcriptional regulator n=1 Tax=Saccharomonospora sp. NPDC046836 TaxID=3156921 RepID=UPI0033C5F93C
MAESRGALSSVDKALAILTAFDRSHQVMGVSKVARRIGLPKSTTHRLLAVLVSWGLVSREGTMYSPGRKLMELSSLGQMPTLRDIALPHLQDLYELTRQTVHLAVLDKSDVLYVEKLYGHNRVVTPSAVGGRVPASCAAIGKAMLAYSPEDVEAFEARPLPRLTSNSIAELRRLRLELEQVRLTGVAYDRQEAAAGLTCVAAPILTPARELIGGVSVAGPARSFVPSAFSVAVRTAAAQIARSLLSPSARHPRLWTMSAAGYVRIDVSER